MATKNTNTSNTASSDGAFELQAKADEWMDITPKEELLQAELDRFRNAFCKCSEQLECSRLENGLLNDRQVVLETQAASLKQSLETSAEQATATRSELESTLDSTRKQLDDLERALSERTKQAELEASRHQLELSAATSKHASELAQARTETERLQAAQSASKLEHQRLQQSLKDTRTESTTHKNTAVRFAGDLRILREQHACTRKELSDCRHALERETESHAASKTTKGKVAVLAESLKDTNKKLENDLAQAHRAMEINANRRTEEHKVATKQLEEFKAMAHDANAKKLSTDHQLQALQSDLTDRLQDLEALNKSHAKLQETLKDAEKDLRDAKMDKKSLTAHLAATETGRHELLEHQSELQETLEEVQDELDRAHTEIHTTREQLEESLAELQAVQQTTQEQQQQQQQQDRDDSEQQKQQQQQHDLELERRLEEQQKVFEDRLAQIHAILGLSFAKAVRKEVRTIQRSALEQMAIKSSPMLKVPLLLADHNKKQKQQKRRRPSGVKAA